MSTPAATPFANSCLKLDNLIKSLESQLGVKDPFDIKTAMPANGKPATPAPAPAPTAAPATVATAAPQKPAAAAGGAAAAAAGGAPGQDVTSKPKKEKADKPAGPPKESKPPVRRYLFSDMFGLIVRRPLPSPTLKRSTCALALLFLLVCFPDHQSFAISID